MNVELITHETIKHVLKMQHSYIFETDRNGWYQQGRKTIRVLKDAANWNSDPVYHPDDYDIDITDCNDSYFIQAVINQLRSDGYSIKVEYAPSGVTVSIADDQMVGTGCVASATHQDYGMALCMAALELKGIKVAV